MQPFFPGARRAVVVVGVAAAVFGSAPVGAVTTTVAYTGTVGYGFQLTDFFGGGAGSLNGAPYVLVYTIDDSTGTQTQGATQSQISGSGAASPVHAAITINGVTRNIVGSQEGTAQQHDFVHASGQPYMGVSDRIRQVSNEFSAVPSGLYHSYMAETYVSSYAQDFVHSPDFHAPLVYGGTTGSDSIYSQLQFNDFDFGTNQQINYAYLNLNIASAVVTSAVPEPATTALWLAGIALLAAPALRRR